MEEQLKKEIEYLKEIIKAKDELISELRQQVRYPVYPTYPVDPVYPYVYPYYDTKVIEITT